MSQQRILLKLSGEALMGQGTHGIEPAVIQRLAAEINAVASSGVQLGLVIGGGNILRGAGMASQGMDRVAGDHMGMLATIINALALQDAIEKAGTPCRVMSALTKSGYPLSCHVGINDQPGLRTLRLPPCNTAS